MPTFQPKKYFSAPQYNGVNGICVQHKAALFIRAMKSMNSILLFENGKIVDYDAKVGKEHLKHLIETDEGSAYLGEVALVDHYSPISQSNRVYFETLYDENASCHLAIGAAYPTCLANSDGMSKEELKAEGLNDSLTHVDFMIGHEDMNIEGTTFEGDVIQVMKNGKVVNIRPSSFSSQELNRIVRLSLFAKERAAAPHANVLYKLTRTK